MKKSFWSDSAALPSFPKLEGEIKTDVLIIGGGICGLLCAYCLDRAGIDYVLVEGDRIASGITKNTTAKITAQHGLIYAKLLRDMDGEKAKMYLAANLKAVDEYEKLCRSIECDFKKMSSYVYTLRDRKKIEEEMKALELLGYKAKFTDKTELPFDILGAVCFEEQAQFDPLKFIFGISRNLKIYENTFIRDITPHSAISDSGKIIAKKIIIATHFPFINKHGSYFLKLYQHRSYVSAFSGAQSLNGMYVDEDMKGMSFRPHNDLLFIGGGGHRTGKNGGNWAELRSFAKKFYPKADLKYEWAAQDCMSLDGVPYIGRYSARTSDLFVASGFNKWGITSSMVAARILTDLVQEKKNVFAEVFSPSRGILKPQLFVNGFETTMNLLTPTVPRCPHLGCALKWNKAERTWDCSCHGSRFEKDGTIIDNPSSGDAKI
ncbi:MAG: FAD-dependent oxidoreductase [Clostridia bacterium]|nr:FAD-dependent oxidoreductase [Clostridia bacterium]